MSDELTAGECPNGHLTYPTHPRCPECGEAQEEHIDLADREAEVVTWTTSTATPPGVREPNTLAIVEFDVGGESVRAIGQATTDDVEVGDTVRPVYVDELRDPEAGIREPASQDWDGFRFDPV
ncbi:Zn-ribbon domain-containing OB-fold protein [Halobacteriales archaeon Cl-PHB]